MKFDPLAASVVPLQPALIVSMRANVYLVFPLSFGRRLDNSCSVASSSPVTLVGGMILPFQVAPDTNMIIPDMVICPCPDSGSESSE